MAKKTPSDGHGPRYRKVFPLFWDDPGVRSLDDPSKVIALYCLTSRQTNRIGIFRFSLATAAEDLGYTGTGSPSQGFRQRFDRVVSTLKWRWDEGSRVLYLPSWWKWNHPESKNNLIGNLKDIAELPETPLFLEFASNVAYLKGTLSEALTNTLTERYPQRYLYPSPTQEQEQEQEQEQDQEQEQEPTSAESDGEVLLQFPTTKNQFWNLTESKLLEYETSFPAIDVLAECKKALQWLRDNPKNAKSNISRYLGNWLSKAQDKAPRVAAPPSSRVPTAEDLKNWNANDGGLGLEFDR